MKNNKNSSIVFFELATVLFFFLNIFFLKINNYYFIALIILGLVTFLTKVLKISFEDRDFRYLKDVLLIVVNYSIVYVLIYYFSGLIFGYLNNTYGLRFDIIIRNILPIIVIISSSEIFRFLLNNKVKDNKGLLILSFLIFVLIDVNLNVYQYNLTNGIGYINLIMECVLPSLFKNFLLTYTSLKVGYKPNFVYRFITELPVFLIPVIPDIPKYLDILLNIVFNWYLCMYIVRLYTKYKVESPRQKKLYSIPIALMGIFMFVIVYLCCGYFTYSILAIGSGSMANVIDKGDAVIVKKEVLSKLNVGDILVFEKEKKKIVHRIVDIEKENEAYYIKTKGDNNANVDNWIVSNEDIIGVVKGKIKYIGYPTIWISELIK